MSEGKGFFQTVKEKLFGPQKKGRMRMQLDELSIKVLKDERLDARVQVIMALKQVLSNPLERTGPEEYVQDLCDRMQKLDAVVRGAGITYLRGGDASAVREVTIAWERLFSLSLNIADTVKYIIKRDGEASLNQWAICYKLKSFFDVEVTPYGYMIIDASFYDKDISEKTAAVIVQQPNTENMRMQDLLRFVTEKEEVK